MSIADLYADEAMQAVRDRAARPVLGPQPEADHSWADLAKAPFQGATSGGLEAGASGLESAAGFGQVMAATGTMSAGGMFALPDSQEQKQNEAAHLKLMSQGLDMTDPQADRLRMTAKDVMPDPQTSSTAANIVAQLGRFGGKAVGYMGTGGAPGVLPLSIDEALTEADRLRQQGVDYQTRTEAGALTGVTTGVSMLLPMSGATWLTRLGKGVAIGEGSNIGQQAAEKFILQHAGYAQLASQYNPFDPVSLAVGAVPGVFGAAFGHARVPLTDVVEHLETGGIQNREAAVSPTGAEGRMQVEPATQLDPGFGVRPADLSGTPEQQAAEKTRVGRDYITALQAHYGDDAKALAAYNWGPGHLNAAVKAHGDDWLAHAPTETQRYVTRGMELAHGPDGATVDAARVTQTADALDRSRLTPDTDLAGRDFHDQAVQTAFDQIARGDDVSVPNADRLLPVADEARSTADRIQALEDERASLLGEAGNELPAGEPSALRQQLAELESQAPDTSTTAVKARANELQGPGVSYKAALAQAQRESSAAAAQHAQRAQALQDQLSTHASAAQARERIDVIERQLTAEQATLAEQGPAPTRVASGVAAALEEMRRTPQQRVASLADAVRQLRDLRSPPEPAVRPNHAAFHEAEAAGPETAPREPTTPGEAGGPEASRETSPVEGAATALEQHNPDLMVHLDGMAEPMRLGDLMAAIREEAAGDVSDSKLLEIAAQCAIRN